jgi:HK97 family phage portal protein
MGLMQRAAERRSLTSGTANPRSWLLELLGAGARTASGRHVTADSALLLSAVFDAVRLVAESCATIPLRVYRERPDRGKDALPDHQVARLLDDQPNPWQTAVDFRAMMQAHVELRGNAYAKKVTTRGGAITALVPMHPDRVTVRQAPDGSFWYRWAPVYPGGVVGEPETLHQDEVLHRRNFGTDGFLGLSTIALARESIGLGLSAEEYAARFFENNAQPGGILEAPGKLTEKAFDRLRESFARRHEGPGNAHRFALLEGGLTWKQVGLANTDSQLLESRQFQIEDIARWFHVPPHMIGHLERATNNNIEQQSLEFVTYSVRPRLVRSEAEYRRDLLLPRERGTVRVKHLVDAFLRGDFAGRMNGYAIGRQWGWLSVNDINELEDRDPVPHGDERLRPLNMVVIGEDLPADPTPPDPAQQPSTAAPVGGDQPPAPGTGTRADRRSVQQRSLVVRMRLARAARAVFEDAAARAVRREVEAARRMLARAAEQPDVAGVVATVAGWQPEWLAAHRAHVERALAPAVRMLAESTLGEAAWEVQGDADGVDLDTFAADYTAGLAAREAGVSRGLPEAIGSAPDVPAAVAALEARLAAWDAGRAAALAQRETVQLGAATARAVWRAAGVPAVRLVAGPECVVCSAIDGRTAPIGDPLVAAGEVVALADGATWTAERALAHPPLTTGCRCGLAPHYPRPET